MSNDKKSDFNFFKFQKLTIISVWFYAIAIMHKTILMIVALLYLLPIIKFVLFIARHFFGLLTGTSQDVFEKTNQDSKEKPVIYRLIKVVSHIEYYFQFYRFIFVGVPVVVWCLVVTVMFLLNKQPLILSEYIILLGLSFLVLWHVGQKKMADLRASQLVRLFPDIHPKVYFRKYQFELAYGGVDFFHSDPGEQFWAEHTDFTKGERATQKLSIFFQALFDTSYIAHICLTGLKYLGPNYLKTYADDIASMWGKRLLQRAGAGFTIEGKEKIDGLKGKFLLIFNHKSAFDFAITSYALSHVRVNNRMMRPRFILAQDHFKDNWFLYHMVGMGKAAQAMDMIFVSRKDSKKSFDNLKQAAKAMIEKDVDIAIYPQGTRAAGNDDRAQKRRDAGFYTTVRKKDLESPWPHLKKGTGYLVLNILTEMKERGLNEPLNLIFIGISGTGTTLPKGCLKVQTETQISFKVGDVVSLTPDMLDQELLSAELKDKNSVNKKLVSDITELINEKLVSVLGIKQLLLQRFLTEIKGQFRYDNEKIALVNQAILELGENDDVIYAILDRIYSLPIKQWNGYLSQVSQLLMDKQNIKRLQELAAELAQEMIKK